MENSIPLKDALIDNEDKDNEKKSQIKFERSSTLLAEDFSNDIIKDVNDSLKERISFDDKKSILVTKNENIKDSKKDSTYVEVSLDPVKLDDDFDDTKSELKSLRSSKSSSETPASSDESEIYEKSRLEKCLDFMLCRGRSAPPKFKEKPISIYQLFKFGDRSDSILVILGCILSLICGICQPIFALITGKLANTLLLEDVTSDSFVDECIKCIVYFIAIGIFLSIVAFLQFYVFNVACVRIVRNLRCAYLNSILKQDAAWFEKNHSGTLNTKLNDNIERICDGIGDKFGLLLRNSCQFVTGLAVAFYTSWRMTLPLCILSPTIAFIMGLTGRLMTYYTKQEMEIYSQAGKVALEAISSIRTVSSLNGQKEEVKNYSKLLEAAKTKGLKKGLVNGLLSSSINLIVLSFIGVCVLYGSILYKYSLIEGPGEIFIVILCLMSGAYHLGLASPHMMVILTARVAAATIYKTIDRLPSIDSTSGKGKTLYDVKGKINLNNVSFSYPTQKDTKVLKNFSIEVNPGETVALVGHSGSGKSTTASILTRLYEYNEGSVTIDGVDIRDLNVKWLRTMIGIVQQSPIVFNDTVENNLKIGNPTLTHDQMINACKIANAHDFIMNLPKRYETRIGDGGVQLSGGQCQRVCIARTIARNPKILILDEATSALDSKSESIVQNALTKASKGRSTLVIAHRLASIKNADRIYVLDKGVVIETGTHNELLSMNGAYTNYVNSQLIEGDNSNESITTNKTLDSTHKKTPKDALNPFFEIDNESDSSCSIFDDTNQKTITSMKSLRSRKTTFNEDMDTPMNEIIKKNVHQTYNREFKQIKPDLDAEGEMMEEEVKARGAKPASLLDIFKMAREQWVTFGIATTIAVIIASSSPILGLLYGLSFGIYEDGKLDHVDDAMYICFGIMLFALYQSTLTSISSYLFTKVGENVTMNMRIKGFSNILYQEGAFFDDPSNTPGKLITRLATDAPNVKAAMDSRFNKVAQGILSLFSAIIFSMLINWRIALFGAFLFILQGLLQFYLARKVHKHSNEMIAKDEAGRLAVEAIEKVKTIQLLTAEDAINEIYQMNSKSQQNIELKKAPIQALNFASTHGLQQFTQAFCYAIGLVLLLNDLSDKVSVFQVVQLLYFGSAGIISASELFPEFVKSRLAASLMMQLIERVPATGDPDSGKEIVIDGEIDLEDVYFAYPQRKNHLVMKKFNLRVEKGQSVALVGSSGSGKSTVVSLLERFYDPSTGIITIDGNDTTTLHISQMRSQMALVGQMPKLFSGTIKENILYGLDKEKYTMNDVIEAATAANASSFIECLPGGYDYEIGEKGGCLSGGQAQRIAIARALIRKPKILLLDEATSALDSASEKAVQNALEYASAGRTTISIAHRISSIQNCDLIVYVDGGKIKEMGNHKQLLAMNGLYAELIEKQNLGAN
uniref:ABC transmembrane type-1 domain-containing protein n=1 Tax=Parastrongyloides trichosuri TaxID=131310 RepID=A0A0N4ZBS0_PARTI